MGLILNELSISTVVKLATVEMLIYLIVKLLRSTHLAALRQGKSRGGAIRREMNEQAERQTCHFPPSAKTLTFPGGRLCAKGGVLNTGVEVFGKSAIFVQTMN